MSNLMLAKELSFTSCSCTTAFTTGFLIWGYLGFTGCHLRQITFIKKNICNICEFECKSPLLKNHRPSHKTPTPGISSHLSLGLSNKLSNHYMLFIHVSLMWPSEVENKSILQKTPDSSDTRPKGTQAEADFKASSLRSTFYNTQKHHAIFQVT